ncbi:MAG: hypothetical protein D6741_17430 [Planctomycetota bacterium]|nr:MAG: hypothetical protein D6741_17430 [Planctomycetota bacterium]
MCDERPTAQSVAVCTKEAFSRRLSFPLYRAVSGLGTVAAVCAREAGSVSRGLGRPCAGSIAGDAARGAVAFTFCSGDKRKNPPPIVGNRALFGLR